MVQLVQKITAIIKTYFISEVKRCRSPDLANKNSRQRSAQHPPTGGSWACCFIGLPMLSLGNVPFAPAVMIFGCDQSPSSTASEAVCPIRCAYTTSSFRSSSYFPHHCGNPAKYPRTESVSDTFGLPCGGSATCSISRRWHRKLSVGLLSQATYVICFYTKNVNVAMGNAWRRCKIDLYKEGKKFI